MMSPLPRILILTSLAALLAAAFLAGYRASPVTLVEQQTLSAEALDTSRLAPPLERFRYARPAWEEIESPRAPVPGSALTKLVVAPPPVYEREQKSHGQVPSSPPQEQRPVSPAVNYAQLADTGLDFDALAPGSFAQLVWHAGETLYGAAIPTPVLVARGSREGPTLCVTAAVHGDELNGIESVRELMYSLDAAKLKGMLIGVPIVNLQGFQRHSRYLSDRRDLNRYFPGNPRGSVAARMAHSFFNDIIQRCHHLVDLHTGSFHRTNLPQLRADLNDEGVLMLTKGFGSTTILHSEGGEGTLRRAAVLAGIPAVTLEAGEPLRLQQDAVRHTVKALFTLMSKLDMYPRRGFWRTPAPTYYSSNWVRADQGGMFFSDVKLGRRVRQGDVLGSVTDPITNEHLKITAPFAGRIIGMAVNQFVMPGYATFHLAAETDLDHIVEGDDAHSHGIDIAVMESMGDERSE